MTIRLTEPLRREIEIDGEPYTILLTPAGIQISRKRFRHGQLIAWRALLRQEGPERPDAPSGSA
jgi:hypothetical protein